MGLVQKYRSTIVEARFSRDQHRTFHFQAEFEKLQLSLLPHSSICQILILPTLIPDLLFSQLLKSQDVYSACRHGTVGNNSYKKSILGSKEPAFGMIIFCSFFLRLSSLRLCFCAISTRGRLPPPTQLTNTNGQLTMFRPHYIFLAAGGNWEIRTPVNKQG